MNTTHIENNQSLAVCLHASASSSRQWTQLSDMLSGTIRTIMPDLVGYGAAKPYQNGTQFHFEDEVEGVLRQVKEQTGKDNGPLHLVGHSYGAATALQIALVHPERVASLTLYEPAQFLLLFDEGLKSEEAHEILAVRKFVRDNIKSPIRCWSAARHFIDYWSGDGAWEQIPFKRQRQFVSLMPKVAAEFDAIFSANVSADDFASLNIPVRLIFGSETRVTTRKVTEVLTRVLPNVESVLVDGAAHMGPTTQQNLINPLLAEHVTASLQEAYEAIA